tara:strand:- start:121 stop:495 length:375 start_codon:yes stop_codon:yes gene_type:complete
MINNIVQKVAIAFKAGNPPKTTQAKLKISHHQYYRALKKARETDLVEKPMPLRAQYYRMTNELKLRRARLGKVSAVAMNLEPKTREWLLAQIPDGGRLDELLTSIINDLYEEEFGEIIPENPSN